MSDVKIARGLLWTSASGQQVPGWTGPIKRCRERDTNFTGCLRKSCKKKLLLLLQAEPYGHKEHFALQELHAQLRSNTTEVAAKQAGHLRIAANLVKINRPGFMAERIGDSKPKRKSRIIKTEHRKKCFKVISAATTNTHQLLQVANWKSWVEEQLDQFYWIMNKAAPKMCASRWCVYFNLIVTWT